MKSRDTVDRLSPRRAIRAGWSRTRIPISATMRVLDVGSGAFPHWRADVLCDGELEDNRHRAGLPAVIDRPFVIADAAALPFRDLAFDFVIASHIAEHVEDPDGLCEELGRVAFAGYVETPSPFADWLLHEDYHLWRVRNRRGVLHFRPKQPRRRLVAAVNDRFYRVFYAAQPSCHRPVYRLPAGVSGKIIRFLLRGFGGVLNRTGIMHTRYLFGQGRPMACKVGKAGAT